MANGKRQNRREVVNHWVCRLIIVSYNATMFFWTSKEYFELGLMGIQVGDGICALRRWEISTFASAERRVLRACPYLLYAGSNGWQGFRWTWERGILHTAHSNRMIKRILPLYLVCAGQSRVHSAIASLSCYITSARASGFFSRYKNTGLCILS